MAYASLDDLIARAGEGEVLQVADRDNDGAADHAVIVAAFLYADTQIDTYVSSVYRLPLNPVPDVVRSWAVAIARYHLHRDGAPDYVIRDHNQALASLKDVARGIIKLPVVADQPAPPVNDTGAVFVDGPEPAFTADRLAGWL